MPIGPTSSDIAGLRAFNRLYTRQLGLLQPRLDNSPFTLTEARILYELAHRPAVTASDIGHDLDIGRAQLSRTLKRFIGRGLLETDSHPGDGRRRPLRLTTAGYAAFAALEQNTNQAMEQLLAAIPAGKRAYLLATIRTISEIFEERTPSTMKLRDLQPGDLGWIAHRQAVLYATEYGWNNEYEALVARILADFVQDFDPAHDGAWIAEIDGRVIGSVFLVRGEASGIGKLRLLYVEPDARGRGIGATLVQACIDRARSVGDEHLVLWTNSVLTAARRIYDRAGFTLVEEAPHHSFGKDLIGQNFTLSLKGDAAAGNAA